MVYKNAHPSQFMVGQDYPKYFCLLNTTIRRENVLKSLEDFLIGAFSFVYIQRFIYLAFYIIAFETAWLGSSLGPFHPTKLV